MSEAYDVIVLGSGVSGLSAALATHEHGHRTVLLEKTELLGGATTNSYGFIWVGGNHLMRTEGHIDDRDELVAYMTFLGAGELDDERMLALIDHGPAALEFYARCGVGFRLVKGVPDHYYGVAPGARAGGRTVEAELISGRSLGEWRQKIRIAPGMPSFFTAEEQTLWGGINRCWSWDRDLIRQRQADDIWGKGLAFVAHFVKALSARNVPMRTNAEVAALAVLDGRVTGVTLAEGETIVARKGVVLATGGYECNPHLMRDFDALPGYEPQSPPGSTGDGLILAAEVGGAIRRIQNNLSLMLAFTIRPDDPEADPIHCFAAINEMCSPHTMVVNRFGRRFADESYFPKMVPVIRAFDTTLRDYPNLPAFMIFDEQYLARYSFGYLPPGTPMPSSVVRGDTPAELGRKLGIDPDGLATSIDRFNEFARNGIDADFHRGETRWKLAQDAGGNTRNSRLGTIEKPPFYGIQLHPFLGSSSAGILTNQYAQVMHQRRHPIDGLYATGIAAARTELGAGYQAGLNFASGMTFGYIAARHMRDGLAP
jgi:3-oxosteroid 1-dehydrogenase